MKVITTGYSQKDLDRGQPLPDWGLLKAVRKARDKTARLQSELERLNAVDPQLDRVLKAKGTLLIAYRDAHSHLKRGEETAEKLNWQRKSTSLTVAYRFLKDREDGQLNPYLEDRSVAHLLIKEQKLIYAAYDKLPLVCSLTPAEVSVLRENWAFTGVAIARAARLKYRNAQACNLINLMASGAIDDYVAYYLARKLVSMSPSNTPLKFDIRHSEFNEFFVQFESIESDTNAVFERILNYQSSIKLQTREKRDQLVEMVKFIADRLCSLELQIVEKARWRPETPWIQDELQPLDEYNPVYVEQL